MSLLSAIESLRAGDDPRPLLEAIPYAGFLGCVARIDSGRLVTELPFRESNVGNPDLPALHGGALAAFLELTAVFEMLRRMRGPGLPKTVNINVDYLRAAGPRAIYATAEATRIGRRLASLRAVAWQEDRSRPIAEAELHFLLPEIGIDGHGSVAASGRPVA